MNQGLLIQIYSGTVTAYPFGMKLSLRILCAASQATLPVSSQEIYGALGFVQIMMTQLTAPLAKTDISKLN